MSWRVGFVIGLLALGTTGEAYEGNGRGTSQLQGQAQGQAQGQLQAQGQGQGQSSVGSVEVSGDEFPKEKSLHKGSVGFAVPQGNDGLGVVTPWGGPLITQGSQMAKIQALYQMGLEDDAQVLALREAEPRKIVGWRGAKACRNWLVGLVCW